MIPTRQTESGDPLLARIDGDIPAHGRTGDGLREQSRPTDPQRDFHHGQHRRPSVRDIARVALPARVVTDLALVRLRGRPAVLAGLDNGQIVLVHDEP